MSIGKIRREEFLPIALNFQSKTTVVFYSFGKLSVFFVNDFGFPHRLSHTILGSTEKLEITRKQEKNKVYKRFSCIYNTPKYGISVKNHTFWGR